MLLVRILLQVAIGTQFTHPSIAHGLQDIDIDIEST